MSEALFLRLLPYDDKSTGLADSIKAAGEGRTLDTVVYVVNPLSFSQIPGSTFAYWVSEHIRRNFVELPQFESHYREVRVGDHPGDGFRYLRLFWEVPAETNEHDWVPYQKGGSFSPYYSDIHLVVDWDASRQTYRDFYGRAGRPNERPSNYQYFFRPGLTWSRRSQRGLSVRIFPSGCIFADKGPVIFSTPDSLPSLLGLVNSIVFQGLVALQMAFGSYEVGVIQRTPVPVLLGSDEVKLGKLALSCVNMKRGLDRANEVSHIFHLPALLHTSSNTLAEMVVGWQRRVSEAEQQLAECQQEINETSFRLYNIEGEDRLAIEESLRNVKSITMGEAVEAEVEDEDSPIETSADSASLVTDLLSYLIGCVYGHWDVRFAIGKRTISELPDLFAPPPVCSPSILTSGDGLPVFETPPGYPLDINWEGILVDDSDHPDDIVCRVRAVLGVIWKDHAESIEQEACQILGVRELREYFRRPNNSGFWMDHVKRYSKSRRKAPIYWLLQSAKRNYALWLYYYRLDKDTLFKALTNYVEPKIRLEEGRLEQVRSQLERSRSGGREVKQLEKQLERQENLVAELYDFRDKLRRAANLGLDPDLNDGVVLNIAPLWELIPWNEAKKYWEELLADKFEWSSISKQLRERGVV